VFFVLPIRKQLRDSCSRYKSVDVLNRRRARRFIRKTLVAQPVMVDFQYIPQNLAVDFLYILKLYPATEYSGHKKHLYILED